MTRPTALKIAKQIRSSLKDRSGMWADVDDDIEEEILEEFVEIILSYSNKS